MAIERLQSHKEQDQQLEQTHRDASANKNRGVRDFWKHQCQLHDSNNKRSSNRAEGKELALAEEKDCSTELRLVKMANLFCQTVMTKIILD